MNLTARIQPNGQVTIPIRLRNQAGLCKGDLVEFSLRGGKIIITRKLEIDRSQFSSADDDYTLAQRKIIDARLAEGLADIKAGRTFGPFDSADEMIAHMKTQLKKSANAKRSKRPR
ncbi:MAG TPA: AbrB/MazE/SpoVT family DNA-binding domain-containing protein [Bryobacteraceae bacterium]|nr:AbrB/MazE/SpoVT family DNA-binding domain-containing protein [Bryobacteraceae bacterium]